MIDFDEFDDIEIDLKSLYIFKCAASSRLWRRGMGKRDYLNSGESAAVLKAQPHGACPG